MNKPEYPCTLPVGYTDAQGTRRREAVLRKMTGHEELLMTDPELSRNPGRLVTALLANCLVQLGESTRVTREHTAAMHSPDRDFLLVRLRAITFGKHVDAAYACAFCGASVYYRHDLDALPLKHPHGGFGGEITVELTDGYEDHGEVHTAMAFRLPNGQDEELTAELARQNISRAKNAVLARCLLRLGSLSPERLQALGTHIFLDLTLPDRRRIDQAFEAQMPGIVLTQDLSCPDCQRVFPARLELGNFLLPT